MGYLASSDVILSIETVLIALVLNRKLSEARKKGPTVGNGIKMKFRYERIADPRQYSKNKHSANCDGDCDVLNYMIVDMRVNIPVGIIFAHISSVDLYL